MPDDKDDKNLETFKIGDTKKAGVAQPRSGGTEAHEEQSEATSLGFTRIEKILEDEDPEQVGKNLQELLAALETFETGAKSNKDKAAVKKAIAAVERTADLLDFLFQTKAELVAESANNP